MASNTRLADKCGNAQRHHSYRRISRAGSWRSETAFYGQTDSPFGFPFLLCRPQSGLVTISIPNPSVWRSRYSMYSPKSELGTQLGITSGKPAAATSSLLRCHVGVYTGQPSLLLPKEPSSSEP